MLAVLSKRVERNKLYPLMEILLLVVRGMLSGAEGWESIEGFGKSKLLRPLR
ncbi:MAG: transposase family protein [Thiohalocapsa sp.]